MPTSRSRANTIVCFCVRHIFCILCCYFTYNLQKYFEHHLIYVNFTVLNRTQFPTSWTIYSVFYGTKSNGSKVALSFTCRVLPQMCFSISSVLWEFSAWSIQWCRHKPELTNGKVLNVFTLREVTLKWLMDFRGNSFCKFYWISFNLCGQLQRYNLALHFYLYKTLRISLRMILIPRQRVSYTTPFLHNIFMMNWTQMLLMVSFKANCLSWTSKHISQMRCSLLWWQLFLSKKCLFCYIYCVCPCI